MRSVLLRLEGPQQSWGTQSRFGERDTDAEPSKSGVVGLVCAALGVARGDRDRIARVAGMTMAVRIDREGTPMRDYHTAGGGTWPGRAEYGVANAEGKLVGTVLSNRWFLADASFLVALGSDDAALVAEVVRALTDPVFPLSLGRRAFAPAVPVLVPASPLPLAPDAAVRAVPYPTTAGRDAPVRVRLVLEAGADEGTPRADVPLSFDTVSRAYARRFVRTDWIDVALLPASPLPASA